MHYGLLVVREVIARKSAGNVDAVNLNSVLNGCIAKTTRPLRVVTKGQKLTPIKAAFPLQICAASSKPHSDL